MATFKVTEKDSQAWTTWVAHRAMQAVGMDTLVYGPRFLRPAKTAAAQPVGSPELDIPLARMRGCTVEHRVVHDFHVYDILPSKAAASDQSGPKKKLMYFAGGGFQMPASPAHWVFCAELVNKLPNTTAVMVSYPLAPANSAPNVYHLVQKVYLALLAESKDKQETVILGGDSAGGNLSIGLPTSTLKEDSKALCPAIILTISPAVETTHDNPDIKLIEPFDPMLTQAYCKNASKLWRGEWPCEDPRLSVLYADLAPVAARGTHLIGVVGKYDCLAPDDMLFVERTKQAGLSSEWLIWDKQMHCFPLAFTFGFPEAIEAKDWIIKKINDQF
ncbi:hypothetical protein AMS68_006408 [Peltaster fructicola]|uniref:Alpha/beta hydrolase fold-3 domain-containing protein n=1 Tax=Peltaster fructicola TaxID=286661 RepID=A0A6H0Y1U5_9PEZI|nr:hypothetical protein AMS68_006408 [Peltaster fructicola]